MPELPEVEIVAKSLDKLVSARKILRCELIREKLAPHSPPSGFQTNFANVCINSVGRRGKNILFDLDNSKTLLVHLRMSGKFLLLPAERENPKHSHAIFHLDDETRLVFQDQRHFGFMRILETENLHNSVELSKLAPEPFSSEFNPKYFYRVLQCSKKSLKSILLDQTRVCGVGNIYASEAMFLAKMNPEIEARDLKPKSAKLLFEAIKFVLLESIEHGLTSDLDPENIDGSYFGGTERQPWKVYDRENEDCVVCKSLIKRISQNGRSTYYCEKCQKN